MAKFFKALCRAMGFHVHEWSEWKDAGELTRGVEKSVVALVQMRECRTCHRKQTERRWY